MMKLNQTLVVVFVVLLIPTAIKFFSSGVSYTIIDESSKVFPGYNKENITYIQLSKPKLDPTTGAPVPGRDGKPQYEGIVFQRSEDEWVIKTGPYPGLLKARKTDIDFKMLDKLGKLQANTSSILAEDADDATLERYQLRDNDATKLECFDANRKPIAELLIGRAAGGSDVGENAASGTYIRRPKQKVVILTGEDMALDTKLDDWVEKSLRSIDQAEIREISLSNEKGEVVFKREDDKKDWEVAKAPDGVGKLRKTEVDSLMGRVASVNVQSFVDLRTQRVQHGLPNGAKIVVKVKTKDDKSHQLLIGQRVEGKQEFYALTSDLDGVVVTLMEWEATFYEKDPKDFFDPKEEPKKDNEKDGGKKGTGETKKPDDKSDGNKKTPDDPKKADDPKKQDGK